jgi:anhydro-N-acetylmuramic acid kinase
MAEGYFIGQMSGTSLDGIDTVITEIRDGKCSMVESHFSSWPEPTQLQLRQLIEHDDSLDKMLILDQVCAEHFARAVQECLNNTSLNTSDIKAIGCHGQTVRHSPQSDHAFSLQIGNPNTIAEITGITTITDFRNRDIAAGGQGAPLAPAFHQAMFADANSNRVIVNIGGIANITILSDKPLTGFDTGPGNRLMDDWIRLSQGKSFDACGKFASSGTVNKSLLEILLKDTYFELPPPKSTGSDYFNLNWLEKRLTGFENETPENIQATLVILTATTITEQIKLNMDHCDEVLVCGGGVHNDYLMQQINQQLPGVKVSTTQSRGIHPDWVEAMAFAWMAQQTLSGLPGNAASVTGAKGPRICGAIYQA